MGPVSLIVAAVAVLVVGWGVVTFNRLVALRNKREEAWSGIDVQLQRRADLVPNLVETVRGYQIHEREVLEEVVTARSALQEASGPAEAGRADDALDSALGRLFAVAEAYPELEAAEQFLALQRQLTEIEEELAFARRYHNATVEDLNTAVQSVPTVVVARLAGFGEAEYFKAAPAATEVPEVGLGGSA